MARYKIGHRRMTPWRFDNGGNLDSGFLVMPDVNNVIGYDLAQQALDLQDDNNEFAKGGKIHIKKSHKGLFTQAAKRAGMSVQQYAKHILNNPHASATMKKRANFARNAAKWKHALGGSLYEFGGVMQSNGTNFSTGVTVIKNGGTHDDNPLGGVPMGEDGDGTTNFVEAGETVFDNYVYSNRIFVPVEVKKALGLGTAKMTFADASKKLSKGMKERPNDPIEADALKTNMFRLAQAQEQIRQKMQQEEDMKEARQIQQAKQLGLAAYGGNLFCGGGRKYSGLTDLIKPMVLNTTNNSTYKPISNIKGINDILSGTLGEYPLSEPSQEVADYISDMNTSRRRKSRYNLLAPLRYAPALASGIMSLTDLLGWTNKPDYTNADNILMAARNAVGNTSSVRFNPVGNYLTYSPFDRDYYINGLNASARAGARDVANNNAFNQSARNANFLLGNYNTLKGIGEMAKASSDFNFSRRKDVEDFNRNTNITNSQGFLQAALANATQNQQNANLLYNAALASANMHNDIDARVGSARSANLTNFFNSLGDIGNEEVGRSWINKNPYFYYGLDLNGSGVKYKGEKAAFGGMLTKKKNNRRK